MRDDVTRMLVLCMLWRSLPPCARPSLPPLELARSRSVSVVTAHSPKLFQVWVVPGRRRECFICVFDAWECPGNGEGRR